MKYNVGVQKQKLENKRIIKNYSSIGINLLSFDSKTLFYVEAEHIRSYRKMSSNT